LIRRASSAPGSIEQWSMTMMRPAPAACTAWMTAVRKSGSVEEAEQERFDIQSGTANGDDRFAAGEDGVDGFIGQVQEPVHAEGFGRFDDIDEVAGDLSAFLGGGLGRADVHAAIDLH